MRFEREWLYLNDIKKINKILQHKLPSQIIILQHHNYQSQMILPKLVILFKYSNSSSYSILGLKQSAKIDEIKQKYYQLAKMYHPDVNKDDGDSNAKFSEINQAYKILIESFDQEKLYNSNPTRSNKKHYQQAGESSTAKAKYTRTANSSPFKSTKQRRSEFEQQTSDFFSYDKFYNQKTRRKAKLGQDLYLTIEISLEQSLKGFWQSVQVTRYEPCPQCIESRFEICFSCGGKGNIYDRKMRQKVACEFCSGRGWKNQCGECLGSAYILRDGIQKFYVEKGIQNKTMLRLENRGNRGFKADNGDLYITVNVRESQKFKIDGNNVYSIEELDYFTAALGGKIKLQTLYNQTEIEIKPGTQSGQEIRIFDHGLKSPYSKRKGDHLVKFMIRMPEELNQKQKELFLKLNLQLQI